MRRLFLACLFCLIGLCPVRAEDLEEHIDTLDALHVRAERRIARNDFPAALDLYSEILLLEPDDEVAYANSGHIYMIMGNFEEAERAFRNTLSINPENETALRGLARIADPDAPLPDPVIEEETF